jgi:adenylosuccinate synthase
MFWAIQDLQFGSTGKGQIAGSVAHVWRPDTVVTAWGPNAGHTFRMGEKKYVHTMLATSAICQSVEQILIGPGSVINLHSLREEILASANMLRGKGLFIHPQAAIVSQDHREAEVLELLRVGSTMKGTGAALCDKIMRKPTITARDHFREIHTVLSDALMKADMALSISSWTYDHAVDVSYKMIVEGAQGFSLGYHTDFYPYCTSRDVSTAQLIADCRLPFPNKIGVIGVCRTFPIRVANRERDGVAYTSGGFYGDQDELSWADLKREPELTTVTKLPRRVFSFSYDQVIDACRIMNPSAIALTFCDYLLPEGAVEEGNGEVVAMPDAVRERVSAIEQVTGKPVVILSFGPDTNDVREVGDEGQVHALTTKFLGSSDD